jgi:D-sedoheptulose 7-phosphate isomerase
VRKRGSATDAQHLAGELVSRFYLERPAIDAEALTANIATVTAIANDYAYDRIFARQVEAKGRSGDVLIGFSTSGGSVNVARAMEVAKTKGMKTIGMTGSRRGTRVADASDVCLYIPSTVTPRVQEAHMLLGHAICEFVEENLFPRSASA